MENPAQYETGSPSGRSGDEVRADPEAIRQHGNNLTARISPYLTRAADSIEQEPAEDFGKAGQAAALAYRAGKNLLVGNLRAAIRLLEQFRDELHMTARTWERAADASTIRVE